jgi:biopolymer transport protein ExbD
LYLWDRLDWISRLDVFVLAVTLAYVALVFSRDSYYCREAYRASGANVRARIVDLNQRVRTLQSIATAAPYLGLAGTCFGILDSFRGIGMQKDAARAMLATYIAASFLTTLAGLLVALAAAGSSNYLLWLIDKLELKSDPHWRCLAGNSVPGSRIFPKYPLKGKFSNLPAFALIAAPGLAVVLAAFMSFSSFRGPVGLEVRLLKPGDLETGNGSLVQPLVIALSDTSADEKPEIYLNSKKTTLDNLDSSVCNNLKSQPQPSVYVESDDNVRWANVAMVIDSARAHCDDVILLTIAPDLGSGHTRRSSKPKK